MLPYVSLTYSIGRRILVQLCDQDMSIVGECWLRRVSGTATLDLNQATWAVEGTAYHVSMGAFTCKTARCWTFLPKVYEEIFPGRLGRVYPTTDNIIDSALFYMVVIDRPPPIRVVSEYYSFTMTKVSMQLMTCLASPVWLDHLPS